MKTQILFTTSPHGEQIVSRILDDGDNSEPAVLCDNSLIVLEDSQKREIVLTSEEMDSLLAQWLKLRKK
jgi:hypothetical protein